MGRKYVPNKNLIQGMPPKQVCDARLVQVVMEHAKCLERMAWKNMDAEEFAEAYIGLLKSLAKASPQVRKSEFRRAVGAARLSLSAAETDLLATKVKGSTSYARKRLRDAGSGKFLPRPVAALLKIWSRQGLPRLQKREKLMPAKDLVDKDLVGPDKGLVVATDLDAPDKDLAVPAKDAPDKDLDVAEVPAKFVAAPKKNLRAILGLAPKPAAQSILVDLSSDDGAIPSSSRPTASASSNLPSMPSAGSK